MASPGFWGNPAKIPKNSSLAMIMNALKLLLAIAGLATVAHALLHELVVGNFVSNVLYTLSFDDEIYTLDLIANISVETRNSWLAVNVSDL